MSEYVFCISQIGEKGSKERKRADEVYKHVVTPAAAKYDLLPRRADLDPTPGQITTQIVRSIIDAKAIVADLTGRNSNVYYELAVAHAFARPTVILVDTPSSLSFDTQNERVIALGANEVLGVTEAEEARDRLVEALGIVLADDYEPANLVVDVASARSLDALAPENPIATEVSAMRERLEELHVLVRRRLPNTARSVATEATVLRDFVERMTVEQRFASSDLAELVTDATSPKFDEWVTRQATKAEEQEARRRALENRGGSYDEYGEEPF